MKRLYLLVEGQTEETFVRELLAPHYAQVELFMYPILLRTSPGFKGGVASYGKVKSQLSKLCRQDTDASVTTLIDLYALPTDFPGKSAANYPIRGTGCQKAEFLEGRMGEDINEVNFIPYLAVHEFEALLFTEPLRFGAWTNSDHVVRALTQAAANCNSLEDIDDHPNSAPSKRILEVMPNYEKALHGPLIAMDIGLDAIRNRCAHFSQWFARLEALL